MLNGYKPNAWVDRDKHLYVPSTKSFSKLLNYDVPTIIAPVLPVLGTLIGGIATLANGLLFVGLPLVLFAVLVPILLFVGYSGSRALYRKEYDSWLDVERAYAQMPKSDRKRHKATLKKAFHNNEVEALALPLFTELGVKEDLSGLKEELNLLREQKTIMRELGNG